MNFMTSHAFCARSATRSAWAVILCFFLLLTGCGGGADNPISTLYTYISITDLKYPADENKNDEIVIEAQAKSGGEISGGDIDWDLNQTSGPDVTNVRKELSDNNHKVVFRCTAPDKTGTLRLSIKVKAHSYSDSDSFSIDIR